MTAPPRKNWDRRSPEDYRRDQGRRLRDFIRRQLVPFSPYYRKLFKEAGIDPLSVREPEDLSRVPFTSKESIAPTPEDPDRPREFVLQPTKELIHEHWPLSSKLGLLVTKWRHGSAAVQQRLAEEYRPVSIFFTTGRSALPTAFLLSRVDIEILQEAGRRIAEVGDIDPQKDRLLSLFPYAPHLAFWQVYYVGLGGTVFTLNTGGGKVMGTDGILQAIRKIRPAYLIGIPGYVYHLLREAQSQSMDLSFVRGLALGGDQATPGYRARVKELLRSMGAEKPGVISVFGFTEARKCWAECRGEDQAGFHSYPDLEIIEVVDPVTGKPVGDGETGELVYTCLGGRGSCILRYRTGDLLVGGVTWKPCPFCGRTVPRMSSHLERVSNLQSFQLTKVKGTLVNLNLFKDTLQGDPRVEEWQLVIKKRNDDPFDVDELHLNMAFSSRVDECSTDRVREELERRLFEVTEVKVNAVHVLPLKHLLELLGMETQLKEKRIVDLRAKEKSGEPVKK